MIYKMNILLDPAYHSILAILKGLRNGAVYGAKIRLPHAFVMTFLFRSGPLKEKLAWILDATRQHSTNLAKFVFIYKSLCKLFSWSEGKPKQYHSAIAAFVGGYIVFGKRTSVNEQINMYLLSRILFGLTRLGIEKGYVRDPKVETFPIFAAIVWGIVLWLFEYYPNTLQSSLRSSMTYLYHDSERWTSIWDFLVWNTSKLW
ncbi:peroxisomal membrane protein 4-like isoform X3 [Watersipora subatra]|uniref:peroxisomal membrane protein 4-like isoform X3 n=1 Tax=Watersipora subatra TaxID=2589382 RepID=UPI00355C83F4